MLLPWDSAEAAAALSPADRMKLKLKHVAANRAARQEAGEGTGGSNAGGSAGGSTDGSAGPAKKRAREYAFAVDANDHCETPGEAYEDVVPFLRQLAAQLGKEPRELAIYDPYYCNGAVVAHLGARGFPRVHNRNEDFYHMIAAGQTPPFDVLVTNPPYSADHVDRLLAFCIASAKPWFLLMPNFVYTKGCYRQLLSQIRAQQACAGQLPFYITPAHRYEYWSPCGTRDGRKAGKVCVGGWVGLCVCVCVCV